MIFTWLLTPILTLVNALFSALPTTALDYSALTGTGSWGSSVTVWVADLHGFIPTDLLTGFIGIVVVVLMPAFLIFHIAQWCYKELPDLFGFGPGG